MKAQVSSEYLVLLGIALVLTIAGGLILQGALASGISASSQQSAAYWKVAAPFAIQSQRYSGALLQLDIQNSLPQTLKMTHLSIADTNYTVSRTFGPGERQVVNVTLQTECGSSEYRLDRIRIAYQTNNASHLQAGDLPLVGSCS